MTTSKNTIRENITVTASATEMSNENFYGKTEQGKYQIYAHCKRMEKQGHKNQFELAGITKEQKEHYLATGHIH